MNFKIFSLLLNNFPKNYNYLIILILFFCFKNFTNSDLPYVLVGIKAATGKSRFGDCLSIIFMSNYASIKYKIPIVYDDFIHSKDLFIQKEIDEYKFLLKNFKTIKIKSEKEINLKIKENILYEINMNFFNEHFFEAETKQEVKEAFRKLIRPIKKFKMPCNLNIENINIAVHVRRGGGFDFPLCSTDDNIKNKNTNFKNIDALELAKICKTKAFFYSDQRWPFKFPPDSFYIQQIDKIAKMFKNKNIHAHIFTDDLNPLEIVTKYKKFFHDRNITFSCRETGNHHANNIVDDFFAMTKFDCLIRPTSCYSHNAQLIANFKVVIWPKHGVWLQENKLVIDEVGFINHIE